MAVFVIDASATLPWCFADEATAATNAVLTRLRTGDEAIVPAHWPVEVANALLIAVRRKRISPEDAHQFLWIWNSFPFVSKPLQESGPRGSFPPGGAIRAHGLRCGLS